MPTFQNIQCSFELLSWSKPIFFRFWFKHLFRKKNIFQTNLVIFFRNFSGFWLCYLTHPTQHRLKSQYLCLTKLICMSSKEDGISVGFRWPLACSSAWSRNSPWSSSPLLFSRMWLGDFSFPKRNPTVQEGSIGGPSNAQALEPCR